MAEDNNNIETLSYKISVDTSGVTDAEKKVRELKNATKELQEQTGKTINPNINVESIDKSAKAMDKAAKSARDFANATGNLGKASGSSGIENITKATQKLDTTVAKAKMSLEDLQKLIGGMNNKGISSVIKEMDTFFKSYNAKLPDDKKIPSIKNALKMLDEMGGDFRGSDGWKEQRNKVLATYADQVLKLGGTLKTLQTTANKPIDVKANTQSIKKIDTDASKATRSVAQLNQALRKTGNITQGGLKALHEMIQMAESVYSRMTDEQRRDGGSTVYRKASELLHKEGVKARGGSQTPEAQRRRDTHEQIMDVRNTNRANARQEQRAENIVANFKKQQQEANAIMSSLYGSKVTQSNINKAFEAVESRFRKKLSDEYRNIPERQTLDRAKYLKNLSDIASGKKKEDANSVMSELYGKRVTKANMDKAFRTVEAKMRGMLGKEYEAIPKEDTLTRAKYLRDSMEKQAQAVQRQVENEKKAAESVKSEVKNVADTKTKVAKETTNAVKQEATKQADAEVKSIKDTTKAIAEKTQFKQVEAKEPTKTIEQSAKGKDTSSEKRADTATKAAQTTEQAENKKVIAKKKSADESKKSANEEVSADNKVSDAASKSAQKVEQAANKKVNSRKKSADQAKKSANDEAKAEAEKEKRIKALQAKADKLGEDLQRNLNSAPHGGTLKNWANYDKLRAQEQRVLKELSDAGIKRTPYYTGYDEYEKLFNSQSSKVAERRAKELAKQQQVVARQNAAEAKEQAKQNAAAIKQQKDMEKAVAQNEQAVKRAETAYGNLQDRYERSMNGGRAMSLNKFSAMQKQAEELQKFLTNNGKNVPAFQMEKTYDAYRQKAQATRELLTANKQMEVVYARQNSLIARGKQLTVDQYQVAKTAGEEAQRRAKAAGSQLDIQMPFNSQKYGDVASFNREATIKNAMSWKHQEVDSYSNSINRLRHAQEALFSAYQRDPHPKYLQMLGKTRAELSRVANEYKKYQKQINDTGTTWDKFMMRARSHLEWIASGAALSAMFVLPAQFMNTLENLEAKMAGIKQVIPMIEGLKDDEKFGTKEQQIARAKKETEDLIGLAARYGASVDEVMEATRSIGRMYGQGESGVTNTNLMVTQATRMAVADAFDLIDATRGLESAMSQWNLQTENTQELLINTNRILDVWTKTAHRGAASAQDIADAIQLAGTAAYQAGVSFEFFNALVATGVRATARSGNEIGTSIKSMMVSMQTPKAEKALKQWGISLREIGTDGQLHMRNLEDVILDVAMAVQTTEKDTKDLFLALSGGKFQYSKVSAMLKNGDELLRMLREINNPDTVGFTGEQIQVQLDTLSRKVTTIKDDLQGMVFEIGGIDVMKDFANSLDNVIVGISQLSKAFGGNTLSVAAFIVKLGLFLRVLYKGAEALGVVYESFKILRQAQTASTVATGQQIGVLQAWYAAKMKEIHGLAAGRMSRLGYVVATEAESKATTESTVATTAETAAHERNAMVINAETTGYIRNAAAKKGEAIATAASTAATTGAMGKLAQGVGLAGGAVAALGGPLGIAITALTILIPIIYNLAEAIGEANNKMRRTAEIYEDEIAKMEQQIQKTSQSADMMERLAKQYNKISDSLAECTEGTKEYAKKEEQLKRIKDILMTAIKDESILFDENHRVRMDAIHEWEKATNEEKRTYIKEQADKAKVDLESTEQNIVNTENRLRALKAEMEVLKQSGKTWEWLSQVRNSAWRKIGETEVWLGKHFGDKGLIEIGNNAKASADAERIGKDGSGDIEYIEEAIAKAESQLQTFRDEKSRFINIIQSAEASDIRDKEGNSANNPEERGTVESDEEGGKGSRGSGGSGGGKSRLPYESDELAAAIHEAAQTQYAKDNSLTEPLLRGLASVQSGLSQDFNDGVRVGAFGVTEEMGKRFGQDVYTPIGNAMTAVLALTQKISDAGGDMGAALNSFTGGNVSGVYAAMKQQQDTYNFDGSDYFGSSDFGADVIAAARQRLGLPYGGSDLSDEFQTVCTTFIQRALVDAGADEAIVRSLTADANNWAVNAGAAFHPYGDGYTPKPGDIALTGIDESGHSGHVNMVDENGTGYYSAGGSAGVSAHYNTPIETAYEGDIEGYIDIAALTGKTRGLGLRSKGSNARKSVFDFRRSAYQQLMYQIQKSKEDYEDEAKDIELERALTGNSYALAAREELNEQAKLTVERNTLKLLEAMYKGVQKSIDNTIANAPDLQVALGQEGAKWSDLVPEEKKQLASLYKNDNGVFVELVNEEIKLYDALREQQHVVKEQALKAQKYLHMSIEDAAKFEIDRLQMKYDNLEASTPDNDSNHLRATKMNRAKQEMLRGQIAAQTNVRDYAYNQYVESVAKDKADLAILEAKIQEEREGLLVLQQQEAAGQNVTQAIEALNRELTENMRLYEAMGKYGSDATRSLEKGFYEADTALRQMEKTLQNVAKQDLQNVRNRAADMFADLIIEGKSFSDVWESLWKDLARYTINAILGANNGGNIWSSIFGLFSGGGGKKDGGQISGHAHGGRIPGYAQGGGMVKGAGTGTSDSILAYIADKDKFVYLSNGEYVMTAEATKRLGVENLDALNGYADGGALSPTPYVPSLSRGATKKAGALSTKNPNARMEQLMQEQTNVIQGMSSGNGQVVVLNTKASSADVLKAMQENPRQVQAILGQQRRAGFR